MRFIVIVSLILFSLFNLVTNATEKPLNTQAAKASQRLLMDIKKIANNRLVTVGERGHILISDDGENWLQKRVPTQALLTKLYFIDDKTGWAVGHEQTILKTTDGGETWELQHRSDNLDQPALFDIHFFSTSRGIAVGAYGLYLKTNDGGKTWQEVYQQNLEDEEIGFPHFYSLTQDNNKNTFMAGELGFLAMSPDLGETWTKLESPYHGSFFNIESFNSDLFLMGLRGHLFRSSDEGKSWQKITTDTISGLQEAVNLDDKNILVVGSDGTQLLSRDGGLSFQRKQRSDRIHLASAIQDSKKNILLVGINGILKSEIKVDQNNIKR